MEARQLLLARTAAAVDSHDWTSMIPYRLAEDEVVALPDRVCDPYCHPYRLSMLQLGCKWFTHERIF
jgi:hypothetical protein